MILIEIELTRCPHGDVCIVARALMQMTHSSSCDVGGSGSLSSNLFKSLSLKEKRDAIRTMQTAYNSIGNNDVIRILIVNQTPFNHVNGRFSFFMQYCIIYFFHLVVLPKRDVYVTFLCSFVIYRCPRLLCVCGVDLSVETVGHSCASFLCL